MMIDIIKKRRLVFLIFLLVGFLIYLNSLDSSFQFDDSVVFVNNDEIAINDLSVSSLKGAVSSNKGNRPLANLTLALNHYISGSDTTSYHVVNVLIHIINAFLIYLVILKMFGYDSADEEGKERLVLSAFFTALVWLVTPLNSQAVIYIVQRMTSLMTLFFLLSFFMYLVGRNGGGNRYFIFSAIFFILSVMSKENGITLPAAIVLYELVIVRKCDIKSLTKNEIAFLSVFLIMVLAILFIYYDKIYVQFTETSLEYDITLYERLLTVPRVLIFYLSLMILPLPGRLSVTHDIVKSTSLVSPVSTLFAMILIIALFILSIVRIKKSPYFSFAILFFFLTISVETVIPLELAYEHRMYLPCVFLLFIAIDFAVKKLHRANRPALISALICVSLLFGILTTVRGKAWESEMTLWSDTYEKYPNDPRASCYLGTQYFYIGDYEKARPYLAFGVEKWVKNVRRNDYLAAAYNNLGSIEGMLGDNLKAIHYFKKAIEYQSDNAVFHSNLGLKYLILRDYGSAHKAFAEAAGLDPSDFEANNGLGIVNAEKGDYEKALQYFTKALSIDPQNVSAKNNIIRLENMLNQNR